MHIKMIDTINNLNTNQICLNKDRIRWLNIMSASKTKIDSRNLSNTATPSMHQHYCIFQHLSKTIMK